jgi:hypothetical protein
MKLKNVKSLAAAMYRATSYIYVEDEELLARSASSVYSLSRWILLINIPVVYSTRHQPYILHGFETGIAEVHTGTEILYIDGGVN